MSPATQSPTTQSPLTQSRVQLALNVRDVEQATEFYARLFDTQPAKRRPGYANFAVDDPPLKLVLIESADAPAGSLNHLGVEVTSTDEVQAAQRRLAGQGLETATEEGVTCCYAVQDKVWVEGPGGEPWEIYTVLTDAESLERPDPADACGSGGCASEPLPADREGATVTGCC
jgi:catechol 2,3-dioxygenase-like lactoylglutathione lyase family enzyme